MKMYLTKFVNVNNIVKAQRCLYMSPSTVRHISMVSAKDVKKDENFWSKNKRLNRPISPHLTIYSKQLTTTLSILTRITGATGAVVLYTGGIGALFMSNVSFPELLPQIVNFFPSPLVVAGKTALGGFMIYHTLGGIRHLIWDFGFGFHLKHVYISGYIVIALTALGTVFVFLKS